MLDERLRLGTIARHALLEHLGIIVLSGFLAAFPRLAGAPQDPLDQRFLSHGDLQHGVKLLPLLGQSLLQHLRLRDSPRKPVENEAVLGILALDAPGNHVADQPVGNEPAALDDRSRLAPERRSSSCRLPQQLSGGKVRDMQRCGEPLGLRSLAGPRRTEENQPHLKRERASAHPRCSSRKAFWLAVCMSAHAASLAAWTFSRSLRASSVWLSS